MTKFLFYSKTVALNGRSHAHARIAPVSNDYSFAAEINSVPLAGKEFVEAGKVYPIVFSETIDKKVVPVALLGIRSGQNLYLGRNGDWRARYIPAFVRRYPFILASDRQNGSGNLTVCVDASYSGFDREEGEMLFDERGEYSLFFRNTISFLQECHHHFLVTEKYTETLVDKGLLIPYSAKFDLVSGKSFTLDRFLIVDEKKLLQLEGENVLELFRSGHLAWIYFHLASLANLGSLVDLAVEK
ncbi:MAG: SapC family protein [Pseudomonadota bacterium]